LSKLSSEELSTFKNT